MRFPHLRCPEPIGQDPGDFTDTAPAFTNHESADLPRHRRRRCAWTIGIGEHVDVRQRRAFQVVHQAIEVVVGFPRKADDDVDPIDAFGIRRRISSTSDA